MSIYMLSNMINAAIPFLLLPILTNFLSTSDYGILSNFNAIVNFLIPIVGINVMSSLQVQFIKKEIDFKNYISTVLRFNLILATSLSFLVFIFTSQIERITHIPIEFIYFLCSYAFFNVLIEVLLAIWRMEEKAIFFGLFRITRTLIEVLLVIYFVVYLSWGIKGTLFGMSIAYLLGAFVTILILLKKKLLIGKFELNYLKHALTYGVPLIPHALSGTAIMYADKLIITYYHGLEQNGIYSVGFMIGQLIGLIQNSFNQAWVPWVFKKLKTGSEDDKISLVKITYLYFILILAAVFLLWLLIPFVYSFLGKTFNSGMELTLFIAIGFAFNGMYKMVSVYLFYLEKTKIIAAISLSVACLNIGLAFVLIKHNGILGAAYANVISMFILFLCSWLISSKMFKMPWRLQK